MAHRIILQTSREWCTEFFAQKRGVSPKLFNIYINELVVQLEQSAAPGLNFQSAEVKSGPTAAPGPASEILPKRGPDSKPNENQNYDFTTEAQMSGKQIHVHSRKHRPRKHNDGLDINASGSFSMAVNALKEKACRALYAIESQFYNINIPISNWCKLLNSIIQPIALYGSEVWGPLSAHDYTTWDEHPIELNSEF